MRWPSRSRPPGGIGHCEGSAASTGAAAQIVNFATKAGNQWGVNGTWMTCPESGWYLIILDGYTNNYNVSTRADITLLKNGTTIFSWYQAVVPTGGSASGAVTDIMYVNKGDRLGANVSHTDGANSRTITAKIKAIRIS